MFFNLKKNKLRDFVLWFFIFINFFFGLFGFYYFDDKILVIRYGFILFFLFISFLLFFKTPYGVMCHMYYNEAKIEFFKIVWPSKRETVISALSVFVLILVSCFLLGIVDFILTKIIFKIINY